VWKEFTRPTCASDFLNVVNKFSKHQISHTQKEILGFQPLYFILYLQNNDGQLDFEEFFKMSQQHEWFMKDYVINYCKYIVPRRDPVTAGDEIGKFFL
jgi:hypothetical protein